jgi:hypothetical protein
MHVMLGEPVDQFEPNNDDRSAVQRIHDEFFDAIAALEPRGEPRDIAIGLVSLLRGLVD